MTNLIELFLIKAYAQLPTPSTAETSGTFGWDFLKPISGNDPEGALNSTIARVIGLVLAIAAIAAFIYLIVSGFQYITAGGDATKAQAARQGIVNALIGVVIIVLAYVLVTYAASFISK